MSTAGQADAIGGVFRVAVATHLAIHSLRELKVSGLGLPQGVRTVQLDFETDDPTDDIVATMSDGRRCFISAKRAIGHDRHLRSTVSGWVDQLEAADEDDLLVVAAEDLRGVMRDLSEALRRRRDGRNLAKKHRDALNAVVKDVRFDLREVLLNRVRVLEIAGATEADHVSSLLSAYAGYLVENGDGAAVVRILSDDLHRQSGKASSSSFEDWVELIRGSLSFIVDGSGPAGVRRAAELSARSRYEALLTKCRGEIDVSLLAFDVPPVVIENLLDGLEVETAVGDDHGSHQLLHVVRRWRRMLLIGQPGAGKSVAVRELAAHCVDVPEAPLPILVSLPELLVQSPGGFSLETVLASASRRLAEPAAEESLLRVMRNEVNMGRAIFIFDGLDECGPRMAWVAQQLEKVLHCTDPDNGVVVSARENASLAARCLELPRVDLLAPSDLESTLQRVLEVCAEQRLPVEDRVTWLNARRQWLSEASEQHRELFRVPLLAILTVLICVDAREEQLPQGRSALLLKAIERSVLNWELNRSATIRPGVPNVSAAMLLDGYVVLGRILDGTSIPSRSDALDALKARLRAPESWALAPLEAEDVAIEILRFWDERVAVFVLDESDRLRPRSKVFAEIATAMWTMQATDAEIATWLDHVLPYTDSDGAVRLAADLNGRVVECLLSHTNEYQASILFLDALMRSGSVDLGDVRMDLLLNRLQQAIRRINVGGADFKLHPRGPRSQAEKLARLPQLTRPQVQIAAVAFHMRLSSASQRSKRRAIVAQAGLDDESTRIAAALDMMAEVQTDATLGQRAVETVEWQIGQLPVVNGGFAREPRRERQDVHSAELTPLVAELALASVPHHAQFSAEHVPWLEAVAGGAKYGLGRKIREAMLAHGLPVRPSFRGWSTMRWMEEWVDHHDYDSVLLDDLTSVAADRIVDQPLGRAPSAWSLSALGDLLEYAGFHSAFVDDVGRTAASFDANERRLCFGALADAYGVDRLCLATEAKWVRGRLEQLPGTERWQCEDFRVALVRSPTRRAIDIERLAALTPEQHHTLLKALRSDSRWLAEASAKILVSVPEPSWDAQQMFALDTSDWLFEAAVLWRTVAVLTAGKQRRELLAVAAGSDFSDQRLAARYAVAVDESIDPDGTIANELRFDPDLTVRWPSSRAHVMSASCWTCPLCRHRNGIGVDHCAACCHGDRPTDR